MFQAEFNDSFIIEQQKVLERAMIKNPDTEKAVRKLIRQAILEARVQVVDDIGGKLASDPRAARESIRTSVYKKILGANINIYNSRKSHGKTNYEPVKKLKPGQWGGNRRQRNDSTRRIMSYGPLDRGFILRFVSNGTASRSTRYGNRGQIPANHMFLDAGEKAMEQASGKLATLINDELDNILNKKKTI